VWSRNRLRPTGKGRGKGDPSSLSSDQENDAPSGIDSHKEKNNCGVFGIQRKKGSGEEGKAYPAKHWKESGGGGCYNLIRRQYDARGSG